MRILSFALFLCFSVSAQAQWGVGHTKTSEALISYHSGKEATVGNDFETVDGALQKLVQDDGLKELHYINMGEFFKQPEYHDELLKQFRLLMPEKTKEALKNGKKWGFHNYPLRPHLKDAVLAMKQFKNIQPFLAKHGLTVDRVNSEKFHSYQDKDGKTKLFGMGIWIRITPIDFGFKTVNKTQDSRIQINKLSRVEKEFVAEFTVYVGEEDIRLFGKWSNEHKCYVPEAYQMGFLGDGWQTTAWQPGKGSFKLRKNTNHKIRVSLGQKYYSRACLRLHGPKGFIDSAEFNLYEER